MLNWKKIARALAWELMIRWMSDIPLSQGLASSGRSDWAETAEGQSRGPVAQLRMLVIPLPTRKEKALETPLKKAWEFVRDLHMLKKITWFLVLPQNSAHNITHVFVQIWIFEDDIHRRRPAKQLIALRLVAYEGCGPRAEEVAEVHGCPDRKLEYLVVFLSSFG